VARSSVIGQRTWYETNTGMYHRRRKNTQLRFLSPRLLSCPRIIGACRTSPPQQLQQQQQWTLKPAARDFSSRGGRGTSRSWQQQQQQEQLERTRRFQQQQEQQQTWKPSRRSVVVGSVAGAGALIFVANQDDAPYTHRRRFMMVSRGARSAAQHRESRGSTPVESAAT